jgi:tetratricopeptide (TPR) repeat protein
MYSYSIGARFNFSKEMRDSRAVFSDGRDKFTSGDFDEAFQLFRKAVKMHELLFGKYHEETIRSYWYMGKSACKIEEKTEALKAFQRATRMAESTLDGAVYQEMCHDIQECWTTAHPTDGHIFSLLHKIFKYEQRGDKALKSQKYSKAIQNYCKALSLLDSLLGEDSLDAADIRCKLAFSLIKTSATPEAHRTLQSAYNLYVSEVGQDHPATLGAAAKIKTINSVAAKIMGH